MRVIQKYVKHIKNLSGSLLAPHGDDSYLASQHEGGSGLEFDLKGGWIVKAFWEDKERIVFLLERAVE